MCCFTKPLSSLSQSVLLNFPLAIVVVVDVVVVVVVVIIIIENLINSLYRCPKVAQ